MCSRLTNVSLSSISIDRGSNDESSNDLSGRYDEGRSQLRKIRDVKEADMVHQKRPRLYRFRSSSDTKKRLSQSQNLLLETIVDSGKFVSELLEREGELSEEQMFVLDSVIHSSYLFPVKQRKILIELHQLFTGNSKDVSELSSATVTALVTRGNHINYLLSLAAMCRRHDKRLLRLKRNGKSKKKTEDEDEKENEHRDQ